MRVHDLFSGMPVVVQGVGALAGGAIGTLGARLADGLPRRYAITHLTEGRRRTRRNVLIVVLSAVIGVWLTRLLMLAGNPSFERAAFVFVLNQALFSGVVAAAAIDLEHMILPNELTLGGAALALATSHFRGLGLLGSVIGIAAGFALTMLPAWLYKHLRGRSGMGFGDAKLALLAGAWLGAEGALFVVFAGALQAALCAIAMRIFGLAFAVPASVQAELDQLRLKAKAGDAASRALLAEDPMAEDVGTPTELATMRLPMGPFLVLALLEFFFARRPILDVFYRIVAPP